MDTVPLHRPCSEYHADSVNIYQKPISIISLQQIEQSCNRARRASDKWATHQSTRRPYQRNNTDNSTNCNNTHKLAWHQRQITRALKTPSCCCCTMEYKRAISVSDSPWKSQSESQRREIIGESTSMVWRTLGSRTAKEQNRTEFLYHRRLAIFVTAFWQNRLWQNPSQP